MAVTNNIREIREQRGIYQDDLAAAIGYSTKTVGRIERGARIEFRVAKFLGIQIWFQSNPGEEKVISSK